jgi:hypothetical protein
MWGWTEGNTAYQMPQQQHAPYSPQGHEPGTPGPAPSAPHGLPLSSSSQNLPGHPDIIFPKQKKGHLRPRVLLVPARGAGLQNHASSDIAWNTGYRNSIEIASAMSRVSLNCDNSAGKGKLFRSAKWMIKPSSDHA